MTERFTLADLHLGHEKCCTVFKREDGSPLRPFASAEEMDEALVANWNAVVGPKDKVYVLGDVAIARRNLATLGRLTGRKVLVKGNHDVFKTKDYLKYFEEIEGVQVFVDDFIMSHIPLHPLCISTRFKVNVHGHLHAGRVMTGGGWHEHGYRLSEVIDPRYLCVSVEHTNYSPLSFDEVRARIKEQQ